MLHSVYRLVSCAMQLARASSRHGLSEGAWFVYLVPPPHTSPFVSKEYTVESFILRSQLAIIVLVQSTTAGFQNLNIKCLIKEVSFPAVCSADTHVWQDFSEQSLFRRTRCR